MIEKRPYFQLSLDDYPRAGIFRHMITLENPILSITAPIDVTDLHAFSKMLGVKFSLLCVYQAARSANGISAFKQRIVAGDLVEFEVVDPCINVMLEDQSFTFFETTYDPCLDKFLIGAGEDRERCIREPSYSNENKDHTIWVTHNLWFPFTAISHPTDPRYHSIPIISIGKMYEQAGRLWMPLSVQAHHGLVDGLHIGQFFEAFVLPPS